MANVTFYKATDNHMVYRAITDDAGKLLEVNMWVPANGTWLHSTYNAHHDMFLYAVENGGMVQGTFEELTKGMQA